MIDSLLFSKHIPYSQCKVLIEKLEGLSNCYFKSRVKHIQTMPNNELQNKQLFCTIEVLDKAITKGRQVAFYYNEYHTDMKMYPRENEKGEKRRYIINPYQIVAINGRYYLICNYDKYDNVANYRLDRITDIEMLSTPVKAMNKVKGLENGLNLPKHMAEHVYMFTGESATVTFRAKKYLVSEIIDWFGKEVRFSDVSTGIRISELVFFTVEAVKKECIEITNKGKYRRIFLPKQLKKKLLLFAKKQGVKQGAIFITKNGKPKSRSNIWREMKNLKEKAGVDGRKIFPHNLRHLFARTYYETTKDMAGLGDLLGHSNLNVTRIYTANTGKIYQKQLDLMRQTKLI